MKRRLYIFLVALGLALPLATASPAMAQPPGAGEGERPGKGRGPQGERPGRGPGDQKPGAGRSKGKAQRRFEKLRKRLLRDRMGLDEATANKVEAVLRDHVVQQRKAQRALRTAERDLAKLLRADSDDQKAYEAALNEITKAHEGLERLRKKHFAELRKLLTPKQQAQLVHALHKVRRHLQRMKRRRPRRGPPRRPRPPRPPFERR